MSRKTRDIQKNGCEGDYVSLQQHDTQLILQLVLHFSSGIIERAKRKCAWKSPHARKNVSPFLAWGDFHARSRFARSTIPEETDGGLLVV